MSHEQSPTASSSPRPGPPGRDSDTPRAAAGTVIAGLSMVAGFVPPPYPSPRPVWSVWPVVVTAIAVFVIRSLATCRPRLARPGGGAL